MLNSQHESSKLRGCMSLCKSRHLSSFDRVAERTDSVRFAHFQCGSGSQSDVRAFFDTEAFVMDCVCPIPAKSVAC